MPPTTNWFACFENTLSLINNCREALIRQRRGLLTVIGIVVILYKTICVRVTHNWSFIKVQSNSALLLKYTSNEQG